MRKTKRIPLLGEIPLCITTILRRNKEREELEQWPKPAGWQRLLDSMINFLENCR